jgi:hypothetical protein
MVKVIGGVNQQQPLTHIRKRECDDVEIENYNASELDYVDEDTM